MKNCAAFVLLVTMLAVALRASGVDARPSDIGDRIETPFSLVDLEGRIWDLRSNDSRRLRVFVFLSTECPIARSYTKTLNNVHASLKEGGGVDFFGVISDPSTTRSAAAQHAREFGLSFPVLFDASGELASAFAVRVIPEAVVVDDDRRAVYRGKIDDAYIEIGRRRPSVQQHFLRDAIAAAIDGKEPTVRRTEAIGCLVESLPAGQGGDAQVTYARDIAPIVYSSCTVCHRPNQVAPFPLTKYEHVAKRARQIGRVTEARIMPPWIPESSHTPLVGDRRLADHELDLLQRWIEGGRVEGDAADLPPMPEFEEGWRLGKPDLIVTMLEPFDVPADGPDLFQNFVIPLDIAEDKLVAAVEFLPGNKRVVHHSVLYLDDSGTARALDAATPEPGYGTFGGPGFAPSGAIGGWSVGNTARRLPGDMGRYLKKGSDLVVQVHYHPTGKQESDLSTIGIFFVDKPIEQSLKEPAKLVGSIWMANYQMDIPPGESEYRRETRYTLPRDVTMVGVVPHMHLLGRSMRVTATLPDATVLTFIDVSRWDYNWQDEYYYEKPFALPKGTTLIAEAVYDNSEDNPSNPSSPPQRVTWGDETTDEMFFCFFLLTADRVEDLIHVIYDNLAHDHKQPRASLSD